MADTSIEWTEKTWNPVRGCNVLSAGCTNCYAMRTAHRFSGPGGRYEGLTRARKNLGPVWTGEVRFVPEKLEEPLHWRKPQRVFVNSMSDLFHEGVSAFDVARVFAVMAQASMHTFQVLTKRPARMRALLSSELFWSDVDEAWCRLFSGERTDEEHDEVANMLMEHRLPNIWIGVSVEDQATADGRIPILLECPAAVRWVSYEPALGPVDFDLPRCDDCGQSADARCDDGTPWCTEHERECSYGHWLDFPSDGSFDVPMGQAANDRIVWVVVGGESGPGARPFNLAWARSIVKQCRAEGTPVFVKQLGATPIEVVDTTGAFRTNPETGKREVELIVEKVLLRDRKGGDPSEWPEDLRVREYPEVRRVD